MTKTSQTSFNIKADKPVDKTPDGKTVIRQAFGMPFVLPEQPQFVHK